MRFGEVFARDGRRGGTKAKVKKDGGEQGVRDYEGIETEQKGKGVVVARVRDRETKEREPAGRKPTKNKKKPEN